MSRKSLYDLKRETIDRLDEAGLLDKIDAFIRGADITDPEDRKHLIDIYKVRLAHGFPKQTETKVQRIPFEIEEALALPNSEVKRLLDKKRDLRISEEGTIEATREHRLELAKRLNGHSDGRS